MNRQSGGIVLLVAFIALAMLRGGNGQASAPAAAAATAPAAAAVASNGSSSTLAADATPVGTRLLLEYMGRDPKEALAGGALPSGELSILLATVPDPAASHLDWTFDFNVDSIRRAHERAGYLLCSYAYPWPVEEKDAGEQLTGKPGALLFRKTEKERTRLQLVYLVGEISTSGIDRKALASALDERLTIQTALQGKPSSDPSKSTAFLLYEPTILRIVGPTFSGSSRSLRAGLLAFPFGAATTVEIVSGAATSEGNEKRLECVENQVTIHYSSTLHTDDELIGTLRSFVLQRLGLDEKEVAILQESSTEYGSGMSESKPDQSTGADSTGVQGEAGKHDEFLRIPFPMSLQSLRLAYSRGGAEPADTKLIGRVKRAKVDLDLLDSPRPLETFPLASRLSPGSIELLFDEVTRTLGQRGIRAVLIFATDVRDKLFLACELKKRLPDLQLVTTESNILYLEPQMNRCLRGMIVLSTYPLLLRDPAWRPQSSLDEQLMFASEGAEGTFNATLLQLPTDSPGTQSLLADYGNPFTGGTRPDVWGTVVGAGSMLPLFVRPAPVGAKTSAHMPVADPHTPVVEGSRERAEPSVFLSIFLLAALSFLAAFGAFEPDYCKRWSREHVLLHQGYTSGAFLVLLAALLPILAAFWSSHPERMSQVGIGGLLAAALFLFGRARVRQMPDVRSAWSTLLCRAPAEAGAVGFHLFLALAYGIGCVVFVALFRGLVERPLFLHRAVELEQGVTPLVPLLLVGVLMALWFQWHRNRVRFLADQVPLEPVLPLLSPVTERMQDVCVPMSLRLREHFPTPGLLLLLVLLGVLALTRFSTTLEALVDPRFAWSFTWIHRAGMVGGMLGACWAGCRIVRIWESFRKLLYRLQDLVITLEFKELKKLLQVTANLSLWPSMHGTELESLARVRWSELAKAQPDLKIPEVVARRRREDRAAVEAALGRLVVHIRADSVLAVDENCERKPRPCLELAREVVALELLIYVEWVLRHLRHLSVFLVLASLLVLAQVGSYPFQPQSEFQGIALVLFGLALLVVIYLILALNRNATLSRMANSTPGALTLDRALLSNALLFVIAPLTAVIGAQGGWIQSMLNKLLPLLISS